MAYSITITVDVHGGVTVSAVDQLGGCPYDVALRKPGGLEGNERDARIIEDDADWARSMPRWQQDRIRAAAAELIMTLPPGDMFDEDGRPRG